MSTAAVRRYTVAEYLAFERRSEEKHEFFDGEIFAMAGGTARHSRIATNVAAALLSALRNSPCLVHASDLKVHCPSGLYTYPDISVVCGQPQFQGAKQEILQNPLVIVEVLSPSTEVYDRREKFRNYQSISSLREFVLVAQDRMQIEHYSRQQDADHWLLTTISDPQGVVEFPVLKCAVPVADFYAKVDFAREESADPDSNGINVRPPRT